MEHANLSPTDSATINLLVKHYLNPPSKQPYNLSLPEHFSNQLENLYSPKFIRKYLLSLLPADYKGFYVEAGALDGVVLSNTLYLETNRSWTGLLIEPDPQNYQKLSKRHRKAWTSNACLSNVPFPKTTHFHTFFSDDKETAEILRGGTQEEGVTMDVDARIYQPITKVRMPYEVQCFPLQSYLIALNRTTIDVLSLDLQGSEWDVLRTIPYNEYTIRMIIVEMSATDPTELLTNFVGYMNARGYILVACGGEPDYIFALKNDSVLQNVPDSEPVACDEKLYELVTLVARVPYVVTQVMDMPKT